MANPESNNNNKGNKARQSMTQRRRRRRRRRFRRHSTCPSHSPALPNDTCQPSRAGQEVPSTQTMPFELPATRRDFVANRRGAPLRSALSVVSVTGSGAAVARAIGQRSLNGQRRPRYVPRSSVRAAQLIQISANCLSSSSNH